MSRCRRPTGALLVAATLLAATACSGGPDEPDDPYEPLPKVEYASGPVPQDRDPGAVSAALARIDACALLDPAAADLPAYPRSLPADPDGPHVCELENAEGDEVRATVGVELPGAGGALGGNDRFTRAPVILGGAKAYVAEQDSTFCRVALPVSFTHTIEFTGSAGGLETDACGDAEGFAASAARLLANPGRVELAAGPRRWAACDLLRTAIGDDLPKGTELRTGTDFLLGMDECGLWQSSGTKLGMGGELQPVAADVSLDVEYLDPRPTYKRSYGSVNGRRLTGDETSGCLLSWPEWRVPADAGAPDAAWFTVRSPTCRASKRLVADVTGALDRKRPPSVAPQRPVLYAPDEPDVAAPSGCENLADFASVDCAAYTAPGVPDGGTEVVRAAEADPNVNCAFALDAVRRHFGERMQPVTAVHGVDAEGVPVYACGFVEQSHSLQVWVRASSDPMGQEPGSTIAGHPARDLETRSDGIRQLWVALDDAADRGHLYAEVLVMPSRSTGMYSDSPVDEKPLAELDELMADVTAEHF